MIEEVNIPEERKGVLIGKDGSSKKEIESASGTTIDIGEGVVVEGDDPVMVMRAASVVRAIGRGFSPDKASLLLREDYEFRLITLEGETEKTVKRLMARVIGRKGAARRILEQETNCLISVYGKTVAIIGTRQEVHAAVEAVESLLRGRSHGYVYSRIRK